MNGKRCCSTPAGNQDVAHVAERDDSQNQQKNAHCLAVCGQHQGQHGQTRGNVPNAFV